MSGSTFSRIGDGITKVRIFTLNALFVVFVILVFAFFLRGCGGSTIGDRQALLLAPMGMVVEQRSAAPSLTQLAAGGGIQEAVLGDLLRAIEAATVDERVPMIVLHLEDLAYISAAHAQVVGDALDRFKAEGKNVSAYGAYYTQGQYLLASYADELYLHPMGEILFSGYGSFSLYFKELFDKLDIDVHVFKAGEFKSAVEPFTATGMSDAARLASQELIDGLWQQYAQVAAGNRQMAPEAFKHFVSQFDAQAVAAGGDLALTLIEGHLVDELLSLDEANARFADRVGVDEAGDYNAVTVDEYLADLGPQLPSGDDKIGLIVASGPIVMDGPDGSVIGASSVRDYVREARADDRVKALVVRVDSPGGSAFASEIIRQELELTQIAGKPVVISMGNVAASGGYWIAATADKIIAHPGTITGSIGVFSLIPTFNNALASAGVSQDGVGTTPLAGGLNPIAGLSQPLQNILQASVDHTYGRFTQLVARGRDLPLAKVQEIAEGRVWLGSTAHELGLVDALGDLQTAIDAAAELAELDTWSLHRFAPPIDPSAELLRALIEQQANTGVAGSVAGRMLHQLNQTARKFDALDDPKRIYALCESCSVALLQ